VDPATSQQGWVNDQGTGSEQAMKSRHP
jgi:hypothetical protein